MQIEELALAHNRITQVENVEHLRSLTVLDLRHNAIRSLDALRSLSINTGLRHLYLDGNPVCTKPSYRVHVLNLLPALTTLDGRSAKVRQPQQQGKPSSAAAAAPTAATASTTTTTTATATTTTAATTLLLLLLLLAYSRWSITRLNLTWRLTRWLGSSAPTWLLPLGGRCASQERD